MNCKLCCYYSISFILILTALICLFVPPSMFFKTMANKMYAESDLQILYKQTMDLSTAKHLALKTEKNLEHFTNPKLKYAVSFCLYFIDILSHYKSEISNYFEMITMYINRDNQTLQIIIPLTSFIIFHLIVYGCFFSFSGIISSFNNTFVKCRTFCEKFGWYIAAFALFNIFVPLVPADLLYVVFAVIGCPIQCMLFAMVCSHLPEFYIHYKLAQNFIQLETFKFQSDNYYLAVVCVSLFAMLFMCVVKTVQFYFEKDDEVKVKVDEKKEEKVENENNEDEKKKKD